MKYAYIRVSSADQKIHRQWDEMLERGISPQCIYVDYQSGKDFAREAYVRLIHRLKKGDVLYIKSIDRLGRNYEGIILEWKRIHEILQASIHVIDMPLLNTDQMEEQTLMKSFISDLVLQILSFVAQNERDNIHQRQMEGILSARKRGVQFGRPMLQFKKPQLQIFEAYHHQQITAKEAQEKLHISKSSFYKYYRLFTQKE